MPAPGLLNFLLVVVNPDAVTPYDPASTDLPTTEHDFWTSQFRGTRPWIAQRGEGPYATADISIGGQKLELPLGHVADGECQVRVIDVADLVLACGGTVITPEGDADLNLGANSYTAGPNKWGRVETDTSGTSIDGVPGLSGLGTIELQIIGGEPGPGGFILFGSDTYTGYQWRILNGTEGGGPGFVPGRRYAFRCRVSWSLDTGPGNLYIETVGGPDPYAAIPGDTVNRTSFLDGSYDFWTIDPSLNPAVFNGFISAVADASGEIEFRFGAEGYGGSCNVTATISDMEVVSCGLVVAAGTDLFTTSTLADEDALQKQLGRRYYLKSSDDGGVTFTQMLYAGYLRQETMERALTYLLTGADSGRGRRVSPAWRGIDPVADFTP